jgi:hypothetical protein
MSKTSKFIRLGGFGIMCGAGYGLYVLIRALIQAGFANSLGWVVVYGLLSLVFSGLLVGCVLIGFVLLVGEHD